MTPRADDAYGWLMLAAGLLAAGWAWRTGRWQPNRLPSRLPATQWELMDMLLLVGSAGAAVLLLSVGLRTHFGPWIEAQMDAEVLEVLIIGAALPLSMLVAAGLVRGARWGRPVTLTSAWPRPLGPWAAAATGAAGFLISLPVVVLVHHLWVTGLGWLGLERSEQVLVGLFGSIQSGWVWAAAALFVVVLVPLAEEWLFRGHLYAWFRQFLPRPLAISVTAVLFALVHANLAGLLPLAVLGAALAIVYERTGRLAGPVVLHGLFNLNTVILLALSPSNPA